MSLTRAIGAIPVVCEGYVIIDPKTFKMFGSPSNLLALWHEALKETNRRLEAFRVPILPMLATVDDGTGLWKEGLYYDMQHPSAAGHHEMFRGLVPSLAKVFAPAQIEANRRALASRRLSIG